MFRGVVEAIRAHTAYGYFDTAYGYLFYLLESVWVVIEDATMQLYGAVWPVVFDFKKRPYGMGGVYQELGGAKHPHGGSKVLILMMSASENGHLAPPWRI